MKEYEAAQEDYGEVALGFQSFNLWLKFFYVELTDKLGKAV